MVSLLALALLSSTPIPKPDAGLDWDLVVDTDVKIFSRVKEGARIAQVRAEKVIEATPAEVMAVLTDEDYTKKTPYIAENRLVSKTAPNVVVKYTRLAFPVIDDRDYFIEVVRNSDLDAEGRGVF